MSRWSAAAADSEQKAERWLAQAPVCKVCHKPMAYPQGRTMHYACDPDAIEGKPCTCDGKCSETRYGNGPSRCDPRCVPCRIMRGQPLRRTK